MSVQTDYYIPQLAKADAEIARLRAALKPFRDMIEVIECTSGHEYSDEAEWDLDAGKHSIVKIGDLRRAREAYQQKGDQT